MRIIKEGKIKEEFKKCDSCGTEFAYDNKDIQQLHDYIMNYSYPYVICPLCHNNIMLERKV